MNRKVCVWIILVFNVRHTEFAINNTSCIHFFLDPSQLTQSAVNTQFPHSLSFLPSIQSTLHNLLPTHNCPTPFPSFSLHLSNSPNIICCQHTIHPLTSHPPIYTNPLTQSAVNTQFPYSLPFPKTLSNPPNTICCQHTIHPLTTHPPLYTIPLTQSAVNTYSP